MHNKGHPPAPELSTFGKYLVTLTDLVITSSRTLDKIYKPSFLAWEWGAALHTVKSYAIFPREVDSLNPKYFAKKYSDHYESWRTTYEYNS